MTSSRLALGLSIAALVLLACGSTSRRGVDDGTSTPPAPSADDFGKADASVVEPTAIGRLNGKVFAPEGTVPVSNALVYLSETAPLASPQGAYCDTCVKLPAGTPYTYSKADGSFSLPVFTAGKFSLVVQKGSFRRVRVIEAKAGEAAVDKALTTLPGKQEPGIGDEIPRIAVAHGGFDKIQLSLKKLGIEQFDRYGRDPLTDPPGLPPSIGQPRELIASAQKLSAYNIVLLPCSIGGLSCGGPTDVEKKSLQDYVASGGKVYVTDYSYEFVNQTWPGFITWKGKDGKDLGPGSGYGAACQENAYTRPGKPEDQGLGAWLSAIGEGSFDLKDSWTMISKVTPLPGKDPAGKPVTITPKVWMSSQGTGPATVSFESQCGRVLFSTYHAEGGVDDALLAQEKALLYILLEVGVCVGDLPPPR